MTFGAPGILVLLLARAAGSIRPRLVALAVLVRGKIWPDDVLGRRRPEPIVVRLDRVRRRRRDALSQRHIRRVLTRWREAEDEGRLGARRYVRADAARKRGGPRARLVAGRAGREKCDGCRQHLSRRRLRRLFSTGSSSRRLVHREQLEKNSCTL